MVCGEPTTLRVEVVQVAWSCPALTLRVCPPGLEQMIGLAPSSNVTRPVGIPDPGVLAATVAVNVTGSPSNEGATAVVSFVVARPGSVVVLPAGLAVVPPAGLAVPPVAEEVPAAEAPSPPLPLLASR